MKRAIGDDGIDWDREARMQAERDLDWDGIASPGMFDYFTEYLPENALCLDLGCNIARWYRNFKAHNLRYEGLDMSEVALKIARERYPEVTFYHSKAEDMDFENKYDLVFTNTVLQHILRGNQYTVVSNIYRALKPGGIFVMQEKSDRESETHHTLEVWRKIVESCGFNFIKFLPEFRGMAINGHVYQK